MSDAKVTVGNKKTQVCGHLPRSGLAFEDPTPSRKRTLGSFHPGGLAGQTATRMEPSIINEFAPLFRFYLQYKV